MKYEKIFQSSKRTLFFLREVLALGEEKLSLSHPAMRISFYAGIGSSLLSFRRPFTWTDCCKNFANVLGILAFILPNTEENDQAAMKMMLASSVFDSITSVYESLNLINQGRYMEEDDPLLGMEFILDPLHTIFDVSLALGLKSHYASSVILTLFNGLRASMELGRALSKSFF